MIELTDALESPILNPRSFSLHCQVNETTFGLFRDIILHDNFICGGWHLL